AVDAEGTASNPIDRLDVVVAIHDDHADWKLEDGALLGKARARDAMHGGADIGEARWLWNHMLAGHPEPWQRRRPWESGALGRDQDAVAAAAEDFKVLLLRHKVFRDLARGFGLAQDQVAAVAQGVGEEPEGALLQRRREVDQHVATQHQVGV